MPEIRRRYDPEFKSGAVRIVLETGKPIAQVARDLGIHAGTLGNWIKEERLGRADTGQLDKALHTGPTKQGKGDSRTWLTRRCAH